MPNLFGVYPYDSGLATPPWFLQNTFLVYSAPFCCDVPISSNYLPRFCFVIITSTHACATRLSAMLVRAVRLALIDRDLMSHRRSSEYLFPRTFLHVYRHLGSAKFGSFLFLAAVLSKSIELALCVQFPVLRPPLGPLATLSAVAVTYYGEISCGCLCND